MQIEILNDQTSRLFSNKPSNEPFEKRPVMTIQDFNSHSDDHFESHLYIESHLPGNGLFLNFKYRFCKTLTHASWFSYQTQCIAKKKSRVISRFLDSHRVLKKRTTKNKIDYEIWKSAVQKAKRFCVMLYDRENAIATPPKSTKSSRETQIPRYKFKSNQNLILSLYREIPRI